MEKCPSCGELTPKDSLFCHSCGHKLRKKINRWIIVSILLFIILCLLSLALYDSFVKLDYSRIERYDLDNKMSRQIQSRENEIEKLRNQIKSQDAVISDLQNRIPQTYYTKYPNQDIYYWAGSFIKSSYTWPDSGTKVTIYFQKEGYGMTEYGWVPMNCLRK